MNPFRSRKPLVALGVAFLSGALLIACSSDSGGDGDGDPTGPQTGTISGTVQNGSSGASGVTVRVSSGSTARSATTGTNGSFSITNLAPGSWQVTIEVPNGFELDPSGPSLPLSVTVTAGQTANATTIRIRPVETGGADGSVSGTVREGNNGVGGVNLQLTGSGVNRTTTTGGTGSYSFAGVADGSYTVTITVPTGFELADGETASKSVTVSNGGNATANFELDETQSSNVVEIRLLGQSFSQDDITITPGTTVRWINDFSVFHTITPDGHNAWTRREMNTQGEVFEVTFNTVGEFAYFCEPHLAVGMTGIIRVEQ